MAFVPVLRQRLGGEHRGRAGPGGHRERLHGRRRPPDPAGLGRPAGSTPPSTPTATSTTSSACRCGRPSRPTAGWPEPVVVAHEALPARFDRYVMTAGYNGIINRRQFDIDVARVAHRVPLPRPHLPGPPRPRRRRDPGRAPPRQGGDRRPHLDVVPRLAGALLRRPVHLGLAQRRQPPEGPALPARVGRRPPPDAGALRPPRRRTRGPPARARLPGGRGRPGPSRRWPTPPSCSSPWSTRPSPS